MIKDLILPPDLDCSYLHNLYPQLAKNVEDRAQLLDEAFFAYREDADLAWRAQLFGWKCIYTPLAIVTHRRVVLPERRGSLDSELNLLGVRNRFLLQLNNLDMSASLSVIIYGLVIRNFLVLVAVILTERSSFPAIRQVCGLMKRALQIRKWIRQRRTVSARNFDRWY